MDGDCDVAARGAEVARLRAESAGLPGIAWRAHALLSTLPGADPGHAAAARSIVAELTDTFEDPTLAATLATTLERELGGTG
jgi:hypothetical protein